MIAGASPARVLFGHALRNALLPIVTDMGMSMGALLGGAVIVETVFAWPGMGKLAYDAVVGLDVPVTVGTVIVGTLGTLLGNIASDVACAMLPPRLRG
jgi:ABC-type dipeptide/oligopeptide/nickel transport system permease component